jgi:hypothetical protein
MHVALKGASMHNGIMTTMTGTLRHNDRYIMTGTLRHNDDNDRYLTGVTAAHIQAEDNVHIAVHSATPFSLSDVATPDGATLISRVGRFVAALTMPLWTTLLTVPLRNLLGRQTTLRIRSTANFSYSCVICRK